MSRRLADGSTASHNMAMSAEQLIGLEAALGELGGLYVAARRFAPLRAAAENELLPATGRLGAALRALLRRGRFDDAAADAAAREIARLRADWLARLEALRRTPAYQRALAAWEAVDGAGLSASLPELLADLSLLARPPTLFAGVSAASGRRRPGARPFLTTAACAEKVAGYRDEGVPCETGGDRWWDRELSAIQLVDDPQALDTPIALRIEPASSSPPVFRLAGSALFHVFCRVLRVPFTVTLQRDTDDEWWAAYESYPAYRDELAGHLERLGLRVEMQ